MIAQETLFAYPDFSEPFDIHTDASLYQLGAYISQQGCPISFNSKKVNLAKTQYTTTEIELLFMDEVSKEFTNILLGQQIRVHTNHVNLAYAKFNSDRVMR